MIIRYTYDRKSFDVSGHDYRYGVMNYDSLDKLTEFMANRGMRHDGISNKNGIIFKDDNGNHYYIREIIDNDGTILYSNGSATVSKRTITTIINDYSNKLLGFSDNFNHDTYYYR